MLPLVGVTSTIAEFLKPYRRVFSREEEFKHISNYINGLVLSENKTLQGIHSRIVSEKEEKVSRRAMHQAVFEAGWKYSELMEQQRKVVAPLHGGRGREVIALDWTLSYGSVK